jgi:hypothetical protein
MMEVKIRRFGRRVLNPIGILTWREWGIVEGEGIVAPMGMWAFLLFDSLA